MRVELRFGITGGNVDEEDAPVIGQKRRQIHQANLSAVEKSLTRSRALEPAPLGLTAARKSHLIGMATEKKS
jgi:hypothetical protein